MSKIFREWGLKEDGRVLQLRESGKESLLRTFDKLKLFLLYS